MPFAPANVSQMCLSEEVYGGFGIRRAQLDASFFHDLVLNFFGV